MEGSVAKPVEFRTNFGSERKKFIRYANILPPRIFRGAMFASLEAVGNISAQEFMKVTSMAEGVDRVGDPRARSSENTVGMRTGRLAGSIVGAWRFNSASMPAGMAFTNKFINSQTRSTGAGFEEGKKESIREVKVSGGRIEGNIGSKVPYAAIQEFGGSTVTRVTEKARKYFWYAFFKTGFVEWVSMALTNKRYFKRKVPARPYLVPAVKKAKPHIHEIFKQSIESTWKKMYGED